MKFEVHYSNQFHKDIELCIKRKLDMQFIKAIMQKLENGEKLSKSNHDHSLTGSYTNHRECHIKPNWLLICKIDGNKLTFSRTGSHSDLF